jgi:UDP-glucose 4-epimerase
MLITGITGTLGTELTHLLLNQGHHVLGISRDEQKQRQVAPHKNLTLRLADVRDPQAVMRVIGNRRIDRIFHLAALKCVDTLEQHPDEAIATNVMGTQNMLDIAEQYSARMILTSTDKACYPINSYGASKSLAEKMTLQRGQIVCRYGNVIGSRGSFIPSLILSLKTEGKAWITDPEMTRFWMSVRQVADFVYDCSTREGGKIKIPGGLQAATTEELVSAVAAFCGVERYDVEITGIRPGEKKHECLRTAEEGELLTSDMQHVRFLPESLRKFIIDVLKGDK